MSRANPRMVRSRTSRTSLDPITRVVLVVFVVLACLTTVVGLLWARSALSADTPAVVARKQTAAANKPGAYANIPTPAGPLQRDTDPTPRPLDTNSRVTILVMGLDYRDWDEGTDVPRTDSMILVSIDPTSKSAGMLSIPRDMWVDIPGMGYNKINTAYRWGEIENIPGGGPGLAMQTVEELVGVPVDYYALIDFNAFVKIIDEMGGLDMKIREEITVDPIGPGNTRVLEPGTQTLDGATALAYARQRHTAGDDFDRARRQQEVIMAVRKQILTLNMLPTLIAKAPKIYRDVAAGVSTNLTFDQIIRLGMLATQVDERYIKRGVIGPPDQVEMTTAMDGQSILVPVPDQIRILRDEIFSAGPAAADTPVTIDTSTAIIPETPTEVPTDEPVNDPAQLAELMKQEQARVVIKNGTNTTGLASKTSAMLREQGVNVVSESNADQNYAITTIRDYTGKQQNTIRFLIAQFHLPGSVQVINSSDPHAQVDLEIILGEDWASQQP